MNRQASGCHRKSTDRRSGIRRARFWHLAVRPGPTILGRGRRMARSRLTQSRPCRFPQTFDSSQSEKFWLQQHRLVCPKTKRFAMYALIIVIAVLSPAGGAVTPVGVTSQVLGKFKNLDQCKTTGSQQGAGGATSDLSLSRGIYWYCAYTGAR